MPADKKQNKDHLGPVIMLDLSSPVAVALTTPTRIRLMCSLQNVDRSLRVGFQMDATGGIVAENGEEARA